MNRCSNWIPSSAWSVWKGCIRPDLRTVIHWCCSDRGLLFDFGFGFDFDVVFVLLFALTDVFGL